MASITILSDNSVSKKHMKAEWGFSALVETYGYKILFDTGASSCVLMDNMRELEINPKSIDAVFISHDHWDHVGGLEAFLKKHNVPVLVPAGSARLKSSAKLTVEIKNMTEIFHGIFSPGTLENIEHSLFIKTKKGVIIITGCSHPGVDKIIKSAKQLGKPYAIVGGLHGFKKYSLLNDFTHICATHCTQYKDEIKTRFKKQFIEGGSGKRITIG